MSLIRAARVQDAGAITAIYNQAIEERQATFETRVRAVAEFSDALGHPGLPFLVLETGGRVLGWARMARYSERECYRGVGEASIYVAREARGRGLGARLAQALMREAELRGYWKIIGLLFASNRASLRLCRACGFREVGTLRCHARLDGRWRDVVIAERLLGPAAQAAGAPARGTVQAARDSGF
ncbi:MAG TPA: arsinothricin resistance N-acetyltransferase ArsN1 family A [Solirubrobacteraceae bacterium]|jgi:phosphinothricin acetyltransferase|nr:arsinothricin resistance N-acetyltransferase ArsN1 family A [Solirubrobacteraceae bacterium]